MSLCAWDQRIQRSINLGTSYPFAAEGLHFYEHLARSQKSLYSEIEAECGNDKQNRRSGTLRGEFDAFILLPRFAPFVSALEEIAPSPLARFAHELRLQDADHCQQILREFWEQNSATANLQPAEELISRLFLQPYAEYLADHSDWTSRDATASTCPLCGSKPQVGALRPEGDGGKRSLICSLCAMEWDYGRIACAACHEEDPHKLPVYSAKEFDYMRVETCDTCRRYIKTVDLTKNGHAVPVVDELAIIPLDLWATEHGYQKIQPNLLGV